MSRLVRAHGAGESLDDFCAQQARSYAQFGTPAGLRLLLARAGYAPPTEEIDELAKFAFTQASRVQVLRAGVALRRTSATSGAAAASRTGDAPPA